MILPGDFDFRIFECSRRRHRRARQGIRALPLFMTAAPRTAISDDGLARAMI